MGRFVGWLSYLLRWKNDNYTKAFIMCPIRNAQSPGACINRSVILYTAETWHEFNRIYLL